MTLIRQWAYFRRKAALHEAGHVVIARRVGLVGARGYIFPPVPFAEAGAVDEDKLWLGKTCLPARLVRLSRILRCMIAVAGAIAEHNGPEYYDDPYFTYCPDAMSPMDWAWTGCLPGCPDRTCLRAAERVAQTFNSVGGRTELYNMARALIVATRGVDAQQRVAGAQVADRG